MYYSRRPGRWEREAPKGYLGSVHIRASGDGGPIAVAKEAARNKLSQAQQDEQNDLFTKWAKDAREELSSGPIRMQPAPGMAGKTRRAREQDWRDLSSRKRTKLAGALREHHRNKPYTPNTGDRLGSRMRAEQNQAAGNPTPPELQGFLNVLPAGAVEKILGYTLSGESPSRANAEAKRMLADRLQAIPQPVRDHESTDDGESWNHTASFGDAMSSTIPSTKASANSGTASAPPVSSTGSPWSRWSGDGGTRRRRPRRKPSRTRRRKQKKQRKSRKSRKSRKRARR